MCSLFSNFATPWKETPEQFCSPQTGNRLIIK